MMKNKRTAPKLPEFEYILLPGLFLVSLPLLLGMLIYGGILRLNYPLLYRYPVQGLDISAHQGQIDWPRVAQTPYQFVYIKASEGGDFRDPRFQENWAAAGQAGLTRGAYHFFTFCRPGALQAQNFIQQVPHEAGNLPPAVDLEFGGNCAKRPSKKALYQEIQAMLNKLENHYHQRPVLYATQTFAETYLRDTFLSYPLWYRNIYYEPRLAAGRPWQFWQFANRAHIPGIQGFVDLNVFYGSQAEFQALLASGGKP